jgi:hypothetical protein
MALYKKGAGQGLLYIGGAALAHDANCCCATCDSTTAQACCTLGSDGIAPECLSPKTQCECDALGGTTLTSCATVNCCMGTDICFPTSNCQCLRNGGRVVTNCSSCDNNYPPAPTGSGGTGTGGTGVGPCSQPHTPNANDCVMCAYAFAAGSYTGSSGNYQNSLIHSRTLVKRSSCLNTLATAPNISVGGGDYSWTDMLEYGSLIELTCTSGTQSVVVPASYLYLNFPSAPPPSYILISAQATVSYSCTCNC